jgi:hypothetical protein
MKGIGNGRQDVRHLLVDIWKSLQEWSDEIRYKVCIHNMWILWLSFSKISVGVLVY